MKKHKNINDIIVIISLIVLFIVAIPLFLSKASVESGQDYFEGRILENTEDSIVVKVGEEYEELLDSLEGNIKIYKKDVVKECDFSSLIQGEDVRILYSGIDASERKIEQVFAIQLLSELQP